MLLVKSVESKSLDARGGLGEFRPAINPVRGERKVAALKNLSAHFQRFGTEFNGWRFFADIVSPRWSGRYLGAKKFSVRRPPDL